MASSSLSCAYAAGTRHAPGGLVMPRKGYKKPPSEARNIPINVRLSPHEKNHLDQCVAASDVNGTADFLRLLIAGHEIKPRRPNTYASLLDEVARLNRKLASIDNNMNQFAKSANIGKIVSEIHFNDMRQSHQQLKSEAAEVLHKLATRR